MNTLAIAAAIAATVTSAAYAQEATTTGGGSPIVSQALTAIPQGAMTVTNFYKQDVYDSMNAAKESLKNAPGYKYDPIKATWVPV
jgi:hypothetical protein